MAGGEKAGPANASAELFEGRVAILTPTKNARAEDYNALEAFWQSLGSVVVKMTPEEHDQALAVTSHLPHIAAAVLAATVPEKLFRFCGSRSVDTMGGAAGDPELWRQILSLNRDDVLTAIEQYGTNLAALHAASPERDQKELTRLLALAGKNRDALGNSGADGALSPLELSRDGRVGTAHAKPDLRLYWFLAGQCPPHHCSG